MRKDRKQPGAVQRADSLSGFSSGRSPRRPAAPPRRELLRDSRDPSGRASPPGPLVGFGTQNEDVPLLQVARGSGAHQFYGAARARIPGISSSSSSDEAEVASSSGDEEAGEITMETFNLEPAKYLLFGFYIYQSVYDRLQTSFWGVVFPSLFTKFYGRLAIISELIPKATDGIETYLKENLKWGSGPIALIAAFIRYVVVLVQEIRADKEWKAANRKAAVEALMTACKFFMVYTIWTLGISLGTVFDILTPGEPKLVLGILTVGTITALGFMFATFVVDLVYTLASERTIACKTIGKKFMGLKAGVLPGLFEGASWTLMDNDLVNISGRIQGLGGKALDLVMISFIVSGAFFLGAIVYNSIARRRTIHRSSAFDSPAERQAAQAIIEGTVRSKLGPNEALPNLRQYTHDPRVQALLAQYMQAQVILGTLARAVMADSPGGLQQAHTDGTPQAVHEAWITELPPYAVSAASGSLFARADYEPRAELEQAKQLAAESLAHHGGVRGAMNQASRRARRLNATATRRRDAAYKAFQKEYGFFSVEQGVDGSIQAGLPQDGAAVAAPFDV